MPKIFVLTGPDVGHSFDVRAGALLGRAEDCTVRLHDASVSRHHARLEHNDAGWSVVDLASRNGLFWDGARVERVSLEDGREFTLGEVVLKFRVGAVVKPAITAPEPLVEEEEIVLEGDWDPKKAVSSLPASAAQAEVTAFTRRTPAAEPAQPSIAQKQAAQRLAAAGLTPARSNVGARGVLQYGKVESRTGFLQADFDQQPLWIKFLILFAVLVVVAGLSWITFRAVILLRGAPEAQPTLEESIDESR